MAIIKKLAIPSVGEHVQKLEPSCIAGGSINWYSQYEKEFGSFLNINLPWNPAIPLLGIFPKEMKTICPHKDMDVQ